MEEAEEYIYNNISSYRLLQYARYFPMKNGQKYQTLSFSMLKDLSTIDYKLRMILLEISINIEHFSKIFILNLIRDKKLNPIKIVKDFKNSLPPNKSSNVDETIAHIKSGNLYLNQLPRINDKELPVEVFLEIITFGQFIKFVKFLMKSNPEIENIYPKYTIMLTSIRQLRNATAHNNCLLNNIDAKNLHSKLGGPSNILTTAIGNIGISKERQKKALQNIVIYDIVSTLYILSKVIKSEGIKKDICIRLENLHERFFKNYSYDNAPIIRSRFLFLQDIISGFILNTPTNTLR